MAENPLLPNRRLQDLYALMLRCRDLERRFSATSNSPREAFLASTRIQLENKDLCYSTDPDRTIATLLELDATDKAKRNRTTTGQRSAEPLSSSVLFSLGAACALRKASTGGIVLLYLSSTKSLPELEETIARAQQERAPLVIAYCDSLAIKRQPTAVQQRTLAVAQKHHVPVLTVDAEDAVAVYRVMQESALRARVGDGPTIIWGIRAQSFSKRYLKPVQRLNQYLRERGLAS